jgi:hypothetical protein
MHKDNLPKPVEEVGVETIGESVDEASKRRKLEEGVVEEQ